MKAQTTPTRIVTAEEMRLLDSVTSSEFGVPSRVLMENAGQAIGREARKLVAPGHKIFVMCGPGNNGGDGLVAARNLANGGFHVDTILLTENLKGDALANLEALKKLGAPVHTFSSLKGLPAGRGDLVIDAVFGIGLSRAPENEASSAIDAMRVARELGATVLAVDIPSGLDSDTGRPLGACAAADVTMVLGYLKRGLAIEPGASLSGRQILVDISIPRLAEARLKGQPIFLLREDEIRSMVPQRDASAHKGSFGHVLVLAGSPGKAGAAAMACAGALRGGAGLVTLAARRPEIDAAQAYMPEIMASALPGEGPLSLHDLPALLDAARGKSVVVAGPGLFKGDQTAELLSCFLDQARLPAVLDADALNALASSPEMLKSASAGVVITPHPGEMARLAGIPADAVNEDRIGVARRFADSFKVVVVLKGARTVVADVTGATAINPTGNSGMATAGSGDVLAGLCGSLVAQGMTMGSAACASVYVHGQAGDNVAKRRGRMGMIATDLLDGITEVWSSWGV